MFTCSCTRDCRKVDPEKYKPGVMDPNIYWEIVESVECRWKPVDDAMGTRPMSRGTTKNCVLYKKLTVSCQPLR